ncbi:MAG TPA: hypothetical protein VJZ50_09630, partial [Candidatus Limnocylindrales bacterium]|nr:hypothetical protein [Candidatus Limnocylindrales bacterium]
MNTFRALMGRREARAALVIWLVMPTIFLFFNLSLAVDPAAHMSQLRLGAVVLDDGVATPQGQRPVGPQLLGTLHERLGAEIVPYPSEAELRDGVLGRHVAGGIVIPAGMTALLQANQEVELTLVRSDANDQFSNSFTANLAPSLEASLNAMLPALQSGTLASPLVNIAASNVAPTADVRYATMPGFLLL